MRYVAQLAAAALGAIVLFQMPQARGRLVKQKQHRHRTHSARAISTMALLAERERAGELSITLPRPTRSILARRSANNLCFVERSEPDMLESAPACAQMRADRDVFPARSSPAQFDVLESAADAKLTTSCGARRYRSSCRHGDGCRPDGSARR